MTDVYLDLTVIKLYEHEFRLVLEIQPINTLYQLNTFDWTILEEVLSFSKSFV